MVTIGVTYDEYTKKIRLNPDAIELVREHFSVESVKARMMKKSGYSLPKREYIISPNGLCDPLFLYEILKYFKTLDIKVNLNVDDKTKSIIKPSFNNFQIIPVNNTKFGYRDYQIDSIKKVVFQGRGIIKIGTGGGKSLVTAGILQSYHYIDPNFKTIIIVPNLGLVEQLYLDFEDYGCNFTFSKWTGSIEPDFTSNVIIFNSACICGKVTKKILKYELKLYEFICKKLQAQSYADIFEDIKNNSSILKPIILKSKRYKDLNEFFDKQTWKYLKTFVEKIEDIKFYHEKLDLLYKSCNILIVDECHDINNKSKIADVVDKFETYHKVGFTGTLSKDPMDKWTCLSKIGPVVYSKNSKSLRDEKYNSEAEIFMIRFNYKKLPDYKKKKEGEYLSPTENYNIEKDFIYNNIFRKKFIKGVCKKYNDNVLILVENLEYAEILYDFLKNVEGKQVHYIHGGVDVEDRENVKQLMENNNNVICIAISKIFTVGISIKNLPIIVTVNFGKSFIKIIQGIGRGLRKHKDKNHLKLFDLCDMLRYSEKHANTRMEFYTEEKFNFKIKDVYES